MSPPQLKRFVAVQMTNQRRRRAVPDDSSNTAGLLASPISCEDMPVSEAEFEHVVAMLTRDLAGTVAPSRVSSAREMATDMRAEAVVTRNESAEVFAEKLVEDVQQALMDEHIDNTWPACPRHPNHPLSFHDGGWFCDRDKVRLASLGEVSRVTPTRPPDEPPFPRSFTRRPRT